MAMSGSFLDDHDLGCDILRQFAPGLIDKAANLVNAGIEDLRAFLLAEPLKARQQKSLPGQRCDFGQTGFGRKILFHCFRGARSLPANSRSP